MDFRQYSRSCTLAGLLSLTGHLLASQLAWAEKVTPPRRDEGVRWHITESDNFRVLNYGSQPIEAAVGTACERLRTQLSAQWLNHTMGRWQPKCDVILHPSDASYDREVGPGGRSTIASALVERRQRQVSLRRIDVRATRADWQRFALAHELTHVVLAERFEQNELPRWLDEGIAILADSKTKRKQHAARAGRDVAQGSHFALAELLLLEGYPPMHRWGAFYDHSAALVEFLIAEQGHHRLLEFAELVHKQGYDHAFQQIYAMSPVELERRWHGTLLSHQRPPGRVGSKQLDGWMSSDSGG